MPRRRRRAPRKPPRNQALDGIRTLAIISIVLYHLSVPWLPSGHMGVVVFLVLTGYLASSGLLKTLRRDSSVFLPGLWAKRVVRIWPAMFVMVVLTVALCVVFNHVLLTKLKPDLIPSLLLSNNIGAIIRGASYFDNLGGTSPLTHLWYLGVDLQFFIVWTIIEYFGCPDGRSTRVCRRAALLLALVSAVLMAVLYNPNQDPTRVYYGPDTRAFAPLLGAWLGLAWPLGGRPVRLTRSGFTLGHLPWDILGLVGLVGLACVMVLVPDTSAFLYRGGMLIVALLSLMVIGACLRRRTIFSSIFSLPPLVWLGTRSFGLYLWHFPLFQLFRVTQNTTPPWMVALALVLSLTAAELSWRLIERPLSKGSVPLVIYPALDLMDGWMRYLAFVPALLFVVGLATGGTGLAIVADETAVPEDAIVSTGVGAGEAMDLSNKKKEDADADEKDASSSDKTSDAKTSSSSKTDSKKTDKEDSSSETDSKKTSKQDLDNLPEGSITLEASKEMSADGLYTPVIIADSVAGDASWYFDEHMPDALLDSYVGRRPDQALDVLKGYLEQEVVGNIVILDSFSNVPATDDTMKELIECCGDRHVYIVNVRIPEVEQEQINKTIDRFVEAYDNVTLIDWYSYSEGHDSWLYADGEHLTPEGQPEYVDLISNAIARDFAADGGIVVGEDD